MRTLIRLLVLAANEMQCSGCGFWYDPKYGHSCTPC